MEYLIKFFTTVERDYETIATDSLAFLWVSLRFLFLSSLDLTLPCGCFAKQSKQGRQKYKLDYCDVYTP